MARHASVRSVALAALLRYRCTNRGLTATSLGGIAARLPTGLRQASLATCRASVAAMRTVPREAERYAASLRDRNSVKSRTRFVLRVLPLREEPNRSVHVQVGTRHPQPAGGRSSPTKHGSVVIPSPCRTATICAPASLVLNGTPVVRTHPRWPNPEIP